MRSFIRLAVALAFAAANLSGGAAATAQTPLSPVPGSVTAPLTPLQASPAAPATATAGTAMPAPGAATNAPMPGAAAPMPGAPPAAVPAGLGGYTLGPGDRVRIIVFNEPSLSGEYGVTDEGQIVVALVGAIKVSGKTPAEASETLRAALAAGFLNDPKVSVEVLTYRPYFIMGEVARAGAYQYAAGLTVTQAIAAAGGYSYRANRRTIFLKKRGLGKEEKINVREEDRLIAPGDVIRVGERYF